MLATLRYSVVAYFIGLFRASDFCSNVESCSRAITHQLNSALKVFQLIIIKIISRAEVVGVISRSLVRLLSMLLL